MAKVNFGELGSVNFPEEWSEDQLRSHLQENGEAIRKELIARAQAVNAQEAQDEAFQHGAKSPGIVGLYQALTMSR